jgi:hypothetical protein
MPSGAAPSKFVAVQLRRRALGIAQRACSKRPDALRHDGELERTSGQKPMSEAAAMNKTLLYMAPIALVGLLGTDTPANAAVWNGSLAPNIAATTAEQTDAPFVLVRGGRGGGGGGRGGGGGYRGGGGRGGGGYAGGRGGGSWGGPVEGISPGATAPISPAATARTSAAVIAPSTKETAM